MKIHTGTIINHANHDDVIKWKHFPRNWPFVGEFTGHRWIPHTKASDAVLLIFPLVCVWINDWVNNRNVFFIDMCEYRSNIDGICEYRSNIDGIMIDTALVARFMGPTWGPSGADRTQVGPMLAPWTLLSGNLFAWLTDNKNSTYNH